jgi:hypothetical protein
MLVTLVALFCNGALCVEKQITARDSGLDLVTCQLRGQMGIAQWMNENPQYLDWTVQGFRCVTGIYIPRTEI